MEYNFTQTELATIMKRHQETMKVIGIIIEARGVVGEIELKADLSGFSTKEASESK